jgi:hypothetical protein
MTSGSKNLHEIIQYTTDSPKLKVFRALTKQKKVFRQFFFMEQTATVYLDSLEECFMPIFEEMSPDEILFQKH